MQPQKDSQEEPLPSSQSVSASSTVKKYVDLCLPNLPELFALCQDLSHKNISGCILSPVNEVAGKVCFHLCLSVCSPLPMMHWTSLYSPPPSPSPSHQWRPVQTCLFANVRYVSYRNAFLCDLVIILPLSRFLRQRK